MGQTIQELRETRGLSRYMLVKNAGVDNSWLGRLEQGKSGIRVEALIALAKGLEIPSAEIVQRIEDRLRLLG